MMIVAFFSRWKIFPLEEKSCGQGSAVRGAAHRFLLEVIMINFEEELKNFQPSLEVEDAEEAIYNHDLTDVTDIISEMLREMKRI